MEKSRSLLSELFWFVIKALIIVLILINFVFMSCVVNGSSMYPTYTEGDYGYSFIITRKLGIRRFDTAVIRADSSDRAKRSSTGTISFMSTANMWKNLS